MTTAANGREAMEVLERGEGGARIDLVLTDMLMPEVRRGRGARGGGGCSKGSRHHTLTALSPTKKLNHTG